MRQRIAIDMDEVLADTLPVHLRAYNSRFSSALTMEDLSGRSFYEAIPSEHATPARDLLREKGFFLSMNPMPGSREVVEALCENYEIFVATAAMEFPTSFAEKYEWLKIHFPSIPDTHIVFCGDKSILRTDFLIDDSPRHFEKFQGEGIVFTAPHNIHETRYRRVENWPDVAEMFL